MNHLSQRPIILTTVNISVSIHLIFRSHHRSDQLRTFILPPNARLSKLLVELEKMVEGGRFSLDTCLRILNISKNAYPAIVLGLFIVAFVIYGIVHAPDEGEKISIQNLRGPGGRPLPFRRKSANQVKEAVAAIKDFTPGAKLTFRIGQTGIILTFIIDAAIIILQVLLYRKNEWWPGQSAVVRQIPAPHAHNAHMTFRFMLLDPFSRGLLFSSA